MKAHHHYTVEEKQWIFSQDPSLTYAELTDLFNSHFGTDVGKYSISDLKKRNPDMPSRKANMNRTKFRNGPKAKYKIGDEIIKAGYIWVKVNDLYFPGDKMTNSDYQKNWRRKQDIVWESEHGPIPDGWFLIFLDKDKTNCNIDNLYLVNRKIHAVMSKNRWYFEIPEITKTALKWCELYYSIKGAKE